MNFVLNAIVCLTIFFGEAYAVVRAWDYLTRSDLPPQPPARQPSTET